MFGQRKSMMLLSKSSVYRGYTKDRFQARRRLRVIVVGCAWNLKNLRKLLACGCAFPELQDVLVAIGYLIIRLLHFGLNLSDYRVIVSSTRRRQRKMVYVTLVTRCKLHVCKLKNDFQGIFHSVRITMLCLCCTVYCTVSQSEKVKQLN